MVQPAFASFTPTAKALHWVLAFAILFMLALGFTMTDGNWTPETRHLLFTIHKSTGVFILLATLFRLYWRHRHAPPPFPPMPVWQVRAANTAHAGLYAFSILLPLTGIGIVLSSGALRHVLAETHETFVSVIAVLIVVHLGGTFMHHFVDRDDVLLRISPVFTHGFLNRLRGL